MTRTGTITGIVRSSDGLSLPGVTVTATSTRRSKGRCWIAISPKGGLADYQRHKLRVYGSYTVGCDGPLGALDISPIWRVNSGQVFSIFAANGLALNYVQGPRFGEAVHDNQFPQPIPGHNGGRLFRMALGVRF